MNQPRPIDQAARVDQQYRQAAQAAQAGRDARVRDDARRAADPNVGREIDRRAAQPSNRGGDRGKPQPQPRPIDASGRGGDRDSGQPQRKPDISPRDRTASGDKPADPIVKPIPFDDDRPGRPDAGARTRDAGKPGSDNGNRADRANRGSSRDPVTVWSGRDGRRSSFTDAPTVTRSRPGSNTIIDQATIRNRVRRDSVGRSSGFHRRSHDVAFSSSFHNSCFNSRHFCDPVVFHHRPFVSFGFCDPWWPGWCNNGFSFSFSTGSCFSWGFSFSNFNTCFDPCYGPVRYRYFYDDCRPVYSCWGDCDWYWRRPLYGCYRPSVIYRPVYVYDSYYNGLPSYYDSYDNAASGYDSGIVTTYPPAPQVYETSDDGWDLLINDDAREARRVFDRAIAVHPNDTLSQIGYSISAGMLGRYDDAVASMRKALRDDPESLNDVPENDKLDASLRQLLEHYATVTKQSPGDVDALFMTAVLRYLADDAAMAYFAVDQAVTQADRDASAQNLKRLIQKALQKNPGATTEPNTQAPLSLPAPMPAPSTLTEVSY